MVTRVQTEERVPNNARLYSRYIRIGKKSDGANEIKRPGTRLLPDSGGGGEIKLRSRQAMATAASGLRELNCS